MNVPQPIDVGVDKQLVDPPKPEPGCGRSNVAEKLAESLGWVKAGCVAHAKREGQRGRDWVETQTGIGVIGPSQSYCDRAAWHAPRSALHVLTGEYNQS